MFQAFDATELSAMRAEMVATFNLTGTLVRRSAPLSDGKGGTADTTAATTTLACLLQPLAVQGQPSEDASQGNQLLATTHWRILVPYGSGLGPGDRFTVASITYEILEVNQQRSIPLCEDLHGVRIR